jgi:hypothetical protein
MASLIGADFLLTMVRPQEGDVLWTLEVAEPVYALDLLPTERRPERVHRVEVQGCEVWGVISGAEATAAALIDRLAVVTASPV